MRGHTIWITAVHLLAVVFLPAAAAGWTHNIYQNDVVATDVAGLFRTTVQADGSGGFFDAVTTYGGVVVYHLDRDGQPDWPQPLSSTVPGGGSVHSLRAVASNGRLYVTFSMSVAPDPPAIWVQAVDADGSLPWGATPRRATVGQTNAAQYSPDIVADSQGGCVVVWEDTRGGVTDLDIYGQRYDAAGNYYWGSTGLAIGAASGRQDDPEVVPTSDGAIVVWVDDRYGIYKVFGDRLDLYGVSQWVSSGKDLNTDQLDFNYLNKSICPDGLDGIFCAWVAVSGTQPKVKFGRVSANGIMSFEIYSTEGVDGSQYDPAVIPDGHHGAYLVWQDSRTTDAYSQAVLYAEHLLGAWGGIWGDHGVPVFWVDRYADLLDAATDLQGRLVVYSLAYYGTGDRMTPFVQVLDPDTGQPSFASAGQPVSFRGDENGRGNMALDDRGGLILALTSDIGNVHDALVQRIDATGYPGDPAPRLTGVADAPQDQGGSVLLTWQRSWPDDPGEAGIDHYSVWHRYAGTAKRAAPPVPAQVTAAAAASGLPADAVETLLAAGWTYVGDQPAQEFAAYGYTAPTFADSSAAGTPLTEFQVVAVSNGGELWHSNTLAGYSVDNLAPGAPLALAAQLQGVDVRLTWRPSGVNDKDLAVYRVYRSPAPGVPVDPAHLVGTATDTTLVDPAPPAGPLYYVVTAVDVHDNEGDPSNEASVTSVTAVGDAPPRALALREAHPNPFNPRTELRLGMPADGVVQVAVYDARGSLVRVLHDGRWRAGWHTVRWDGTDAAGRALPSGVYLVRARGAGAVRTVKVLLAR